MKRNETKRNMGSTHDRWFSGNVEAPWRICSGSNVLCPNEKPRKIGQINKNEMRVEREGKGWMKIEIDREVGWTSMQPTPPQNQEGRLQCLRAPEAPGTEPLFSFPLRTSLTLFAHNNALSFMSHSWVIG